MNTNQLEYLIEISKNVSMSAASEKLHMTPQALNTSIKKLEDELGFPLLNRSFKGTSLTADGEWLVNESTIFLSKIKERIRYHQLNNSSTPRTGELDIYINYSGINNNILGQLVCSLLLEEPELTINLQETSKQTVIDKVEAGEASFGFIFKTEFNDAVTDDLPTNIIFEPLFEGKLVLLTSPDSECGKYNSITLKKAAQYPTTSYNPHPEPQALIDHFFSDILHLNVDFSTETNYSVYREKILRGLANSFNIQFVFDPYPTNYSEGMKILQIREDIKMYFGYIYKKGIDWSENEKYFMDRLNNLIQTLNIQK